MLLQLPWVDADVIKKISRKGGARSVAELMRMGEQERLELFVTSGRGAYACFCVLPVVVSRSSQASAQHGQKSRQAKGVQLTVILGGGACLNAISGSLFTHAPVALQLPSRPANGRRSKVLPRLRCH